MFVVMGEICAVVMATAPSPLQNQETVETV